jgi:predicted P-loop ATPase
MNNTPTIMGANPKLEDLQNFLSENFDFRYNILTDMPECKPKNTTTYRMIDKRMMNTLCMEAMMNGVDCKDADVKRFLFSERIPTHHPFKDYIDALPEWDGTDRVTMLAARVSGQAMWLNGFHRWMLGMVAQWLGYPARCANAVAPILISTEQGMCKSTFCSIILPEELRAYYTDKFTINATSGCEQKLSTFGLINMDEFNMYTERMMTILKNLMQMKKVNYRKCFKAYFSDLPRIASFIGTSNEKSLLTDETGSRRFLCMEVEKPIDCSPIDYPQLYAQLKWELEAGKRYWLSKEEELEIQEHNKAFYKHSPEEEAFYKVFALPKEGEPYVELTATDIFNKLQKRFPVLFRGVNPKHFGKVMTKVGAQKTHTMYGSVYKLSMAKAGPKQMAA